MASFTTLSGSNYFSVDVVNEIIVAIRQRLIAIDEYGATPQAELTLRTDADTWQDHTLWATLQFYINIILSRTRYVKKLTAGGYAGDSAFTYWSSGAIATYLGINLWSRATSWDPSTDDWTDRDDPFYATPGYAVSGDIYGPWILDDLQRVLAVLTVVEWDHDITHPIVAIDAEELYLSRTYDTDDYTAAEALADHNADWPVTWGTPHLGTDLILVRSQKAFGGVNHAIEGWRVTYKPQIELPTILPYITGYDNVTASVDAYYYLEAYTGSYEDFFGVGADQPLYYLETWADSASTTRGGMGEATALGRDDSTNPVTQTTDEEHISVSATPRLLVHYTFSHQ